MFEKKKLKQHIAELESKLKIAESRVQAWEDMSYQFIGELKKTGVNVEIIPSESPTIEVSQTEDDVAKYTHGITTVPPTLSFDFSEHDAKIRSEMAFEILGGKNV